MQSLCVFDIIFVIFLLLHQAMCSAVHFPVLDSFCHNYFEFCFMLVSKEVNWTKRSHFPLASSVWLCARNDL